MRSDFQTFFDMEKDFIGIVIEEANLKKTGKGSHVKIYVPEFLEADKNYTNYDLNTLQNEINASIRETVTNKKGNPILDDYGYPITKINKKGYNKYKKEFFPQSKIALQNPVKIFANAKDCRPKFHSKTIKTKNYLVTDLSNKQVVDFVEETYNQDDDKELNYKINVGFVLHCNFRNGKLNKFMYKIYGDYRRLIKNDIE